MNAHPDFEALSAFADGEAPEWADHVAACTECGQRRREVEAVRALLASPVLSSPEAVGAAIGAALDLASAHEAAATAGSSQRPGSRRRWMMATSVAASVLVVLGVASVVDQGGPRRLPAADVAAPAPSVEDSARGASSDLGEIPDSATLAERVTSARAPVMAGATVAASKEGLAEPGDRSVAPPSVTNGGPGHCVTQARLADPGLGALAYEAVARTNGVPTVVLGFSQPGSARLALLLLSRDGCAIILRASTRG